MDKYEFYKDLYHRENDRRSEVLNAMNIPIAIISALLTALYFVITTFDYRVELFLSIVFCVSCLVSLTCILIAIYYLIRAFSNFSKGYEYTGIPYPNELYNWHNDLVEYYNINEGNVDDANIHFKDFLVKKFTEHADHNMYVNDKKYHYIYMSKKFLIASLITILFLLMPYIYNYFSKKDVIYKIEVTGN